MITEIVWVLKGIIKRKVKGGRGLRRILILSDDDVRFFFLKEKRERVGKMGVGLSTSPRYIQ